MTIATSSAFNLAMQKYYYHDNAQKVAALALKSLRRRPDMWKDSLARGIFKRNAWGPDEFLFLISHGKICR